MIQADVQNLAAGALGTFNPGPALAVKPKLAEQPGLEAQAPRLEQAKVDGDLSGAQHQELNDNGNRLPVATGEAAAVSEGAMPGDSA